MLLTVGLAYADTIVAGLLAFTTGSMLFPMLIDTGTSMAVEKADALFGTACNVTGDGALAIMIERLHGKPS